MTRRPARARPPPAAGTACPGWARRWARRFFEHWRASLKWQRLPSFERFAAMIERHWLGIAASCQPENMDVLEMQLADTAKARLIRPDGGSERLRPPDGPRLRSQERLYDLTAAAIR